MPIGDFEILARDGLARIGRLDTAHGPLRTPALMPVVNPNIDLVPPKKMRELGAEAVITNSYIILKSPGLKERASAEGVHRLIGWDGPLMTDSGTFQSYVYGDVEVKPAEIVEFQARIGSDIGTALDVFSVPDIGEAEATRHLEETRARVEAALPLAGEKMILAATVQGSTWMHLRAKAAQGLSDIGARYLAFGGVVPLMESYRFADLVDVVAAARSTSNPAAPVHLFGCGHPMLFPLAALLGCDIFDSAAYHKYARDSRLITPTGTVMLDDMKENHCVCAVCARHSVDELRRMGPAKREVLLAEHNLIVSLAEIRRVRDAIASESLWELVETRCRAHPALLHALRRLRSHKDLLDAHEPLSRRGALFYTGPETLDRPAFRVFRARVRERYRPPGGWLLVVSDEVRHPYSVGLAKAVAALPDARFVVRAPVGPVPMELDAAYPACQALYPDDLPLDESARSEAKAFVESARSRYATVAEELSSLSGATPGPPADRDRDIARATADHQFGWECSDLLLQEPLRFVKSRRTGRVRNVFSKEEHVLSIRAFDGLCTLKLAGAARILPTGLHRVIVEDDAAPFVREGKNVFAKFVRGCDRELRIGDEAIVATSGGELLAVGQMVLTPAEVERFKRGVAVKVRQGAGSKKEADDEVE